MGWHEKQSQHAQPRLIKRELWLLLLFVISILLFLNLMKSEPSLNATFTLRVLELPQLQKTPNQQKTAGSGHYVATSESIDKETGKKFLIPGDIVEVLDSNPSGLWLVRRISRGVEIGFASKTSLEKQKGSKMEDEEISDTSGTGDEEEPQIYHMMLTNYKAKSDNEVTVSIDDEIEVLDGGDLDYWFIDNLSTEKEGVVPSYLVQEITEEEFKHLPKDKKAREREARNQRTNVVNDLIDSERKYVKLLRFVIENHFVEMDSDDVPESLVGKKDEIFSNIKDIYAFHSRTFLHELEACVNNPNDMAKVFLRHKKKLQIYVRYLQDRIKMEPLLAKPEINDFFKEFQEDTEDRLFITDYLNKPMNRLQEYRFSLQELLKYTARANLKCQDVEEALEVASSLSQEAQATLRIASLDMYSGEVPLQHAGKLLRQGTVQFWEDTPRGKGKERELFLFEKVLIIARKREDGKRYTCKFTLKISDLGLTDDISGEPKKWSLWLGNSAPEASVLHTFEGKTIEVKESWINAIKDLIDAQEQGPSHNDEDRGRNIAPALKERLPSGSTHKELFTEVEKQYVVVTAPKVSPKPKKPVKDTSSSNKESTMKMDVDTKMEGSVSYVDGKVDGARPVVTKAPKQFQRSKPGETVVFTCNYTGDPEPTASWSKDGVAIKDEGRFLIHTEKGYSELEVDKLVYSDSGTYQIALSNAYGSAWVGAILDMNSPPNITHQPSGVVAKAGSTASFPCNFTAYPQPSIKWSKGDVEIKNEGRFHIIIEEDYTCLEISDLVKSDDGNYKVDLENPAGSYWASASLVVTGGEVAESTKPGKQSSLKLKSVESDHQETRTHGQTTADSEELTSAPAFIKTPKGTVAKSGTNVTFPTTFTGDPQPKVVWTKNDEEIKSDGKFNISTTEGASSLQIFKVSKNDNGWYKIALSNPSGWAWASAQLLVTGGGARFENIEGEMERQGSSIGVEEEMKPAGKSSFDKELEDQEIQKGSPVTLTAKISSTSADPKITWEKDGKVLGRGRARMVYEKGTAMLKFARTDYEDSGRYTIKIDTGSGTAESSATLEIADVPDSPSPPEVTDITTNSLQLSWRAPKDGHSPVTKYIIEYRKTGEKDWTLVPGEVTSTTYTVENLTPRTSYRFRISAVNKIGSSRPSRSSGLVETKR